jgi:hypothetical protein
MIMAEWISVKNKVPKLDTEVIVATKSKVFSAMRRRKLIKNRWEIFWTNAVWGFEPMERYTGNVLYWMPLPEPPEQIKERF